MRKIMVLAILTAVVLMGCTTPGQWTPTAQTKLDSFGVWADKWVGGTLAVAGPLLVAASEISGQNDTTRAAIQSIRAAQSALGTYHAVVAVGSGDKATAEARLLQAIKSVNATVGEVRKVIGEPDPT